MNKLKHIKPYYPWLLLLSVIDGLAALLLWLADVQAFFAMLTVIILFSVFLFVFVSFRISVLESRKEQAFYDFLENPDDYHEELLRKATGRSQSDAVHRLAVVLQEKSLENSRLKSQLSDYEEYVEAWAHETKTPLTLLTFLLDNHRSELPENIRFKLEYIRNRIQESVEQMLYYARIKNARKDYLFEWLYIRTCIEEVIEDYKPLLDEKQFQIISELSDEMIFADRRALRFLLGQLLSNSIKYCCEEPVLCFTFKGDEVSQTLLVCDNGTGVKACDLPYIFEKGFTGDSGEGRKKATGMGLYLANEVAKDMELSLEARSQWGVGFEMEITFPVINQPL